MSNDKKLTRQRFRDSVFKRDNYKCRVCDESKLVLDAHHITDRNLMPNGGYVKENGISLCPDCHVKAETWTGKKECLEVFAPVDLYDLIGSSYELAREKSEKLK